jgi:hypothetical protein
LAARRLHDERFDCEICAKTFVFKWRMRKHVEGHRNPNVKCHYFNNNKSCHYEDLGCMFVHERSETCKFLERCTKKMCQFQHKHIDAKIDDTENESDNEQSESIFHASPVTNFMMI